MAAVTSPLTQMKPTPEGAHDHSSVDSDRASRFTALGRGMVVSRPLFDVEVLLRERNRDAMSAEIPIDL